MIESAVILAAGRGTRLRETEIDSPKPLIEVAGQTLIKRTILTLAQVGVRKAVVVLGFMGDEVGRALQKDADYASAGVEIVIVRNPDFDRANGVSLLAARGAVTEPFILTMADHIFDASIARRAAQADSTVAAIHLCVDRRIAEIFDLDDATKVRTDGDFIVDIGKAIPQYDAIDCGVFAMTPDVFEMLEQARARTGDCSVSDVVRLLASQRRARIIDIGNALWQDVDTPATRTHAEKLLAARGRPPRA